MDDKKAVDTKASNESETEATKSDDENEPIKASNVFWAWRPLLLT